MVPVNERALDTGDIKWILPYVKAADEAELATAFKQARDVRKASQEAKKLADKYFDPCIQGAGHVGEHFELLPSAFSSS